MSELLNYPKRGYGMDHDRYTWSMLQDRPPITWPGHKPLALWININVQHFPLAGDKPKVAPPGALTMPYPDLRHYTLRDYGNRVGIYRLLSVLEDLGAKASLAISGALTERHPELIRHLAQTPHEWMGHSWDMLSIHAGDVEVETEGFWIRRSKEALESCYARPITGWFSPGRIQTSNTPELLAEAGFQFHCDWVNDELPYTFNTHKGAMTCLPSNLELDDAFLLTQNFHSEDSYAEQVLDAAHYLIEEGRQSGGRLLALNLHPWLVGQPHRIATIRRVLTTLLVDHQEDIFNAWPSEIIAASAAQITR